MFIAAPLIITPNRKQLRYLSLSEKINIKCDPFRKKEHTID